MIYIGFFFFMTYHHDTQVKNQSQVIIKEKNDGNIDGKPQSLGHN